MMKAFSKILILKAGNPERYKEYLNSMLPKNAIVTFTTDIQHKIHIQVPSKDRAVLDKINL